MATGVIYVGHDNEVTLQFNDGDEAADLTGLTKVSVTIGDVTKNSEDDPDLFDTSEKEAGKITLKFGEVTELEEGTQEITVIVFDAVNDDGIVWAHKDVAIETKLKVIKD